MAEHNEFGRWGEEMAARFLVKNGYVILHRNWRHGHLELDIVADYFGELVFVEVKSRCNEHYQPAELAVDISKRKHLVKVAHDYMHYFRLDQPWRYDIITIVGDSQAHILKHIERAFHETRTKPRYPY